MKYLVMKDIKLLRFMHLLTLIWGIAAAYIGTIVDNIFKSKIIYGYGIFVMVYIFLIFSTQYNTKTKTDIIINSFPVNRNDVVRAKYVVTILYMIFSAVLVFISSNIAISIFSKSLVINKATILDILFIISLSLIFFSIYLAFQYYNLGKAQAFGSIFYIFLIMAPNLLSKYAPKIETIKWINKLAKMDLKSFTFILLGFGIILYFISLQLSKQIYKAKEF